MGINMIVDSKYTIITKLGDGRYAQTFLVHKNKFKSGDKSRPTALKLFKKN